MSFAESVLEPIPGRSEAPATGTHPRPALDLRQPPDVRTATFALG